MYDPRPATRNNDTACNEMELLYTYTSVRYYFIAQLLISAKIFPDAMSVGVKNQWWNKHVTDNIKKYPQLCAVLNILKKHYIGVKAFP
jgi:hypothetical protein